MGTNKRYADAIDRRMSKRIAERDLAPRIESLPEVIVDAERDTPTKAREPVPVTAWVPISAGRVKIEAVAIEWNSTAVRIEWKDGDTNRAAWVLRGSIKPREP